MFMKKLLLFLLPLVFYGCEVILEPLDELAKEQAKIEQQEQKARHQTIVDADVVHIMHAIGISSQNTKTAASMSVTYLLCADSSVVVVAQKQLKLPYTKEEAKLIMLKELELQKKK